MSFKKKIKKIFIGDARDISDKSIFHKISLVAFFAWIGLGSDPLSSSCYGPEEIMRNLDGHPHLAIFVALLTVFTIFIISTSYRQIINLFPGGGGGYIVATKLISPTVGMISGCALLIDYLLTITISISSGADAIFSFLPEHWLSFKLPFAFIILLLLIILNLRGVKESVLALMPVFVLFIITHIVLITYGIFSHMTEMPQLMNQTGNELNNTINELGIFGTLFLLLKSYSMGAGTYTGIEAVSNGIPNLREPKVKTAQRTMVLLSISLAIAVFGLIISYYLYGVNAVPGKTYNAILTEKIVIGWTPWIGQGFLYLTLFSEAALLFVAAQTGFLDGPRVMANMAMDHWLPRKFTHLSDRLVSQNGILIMGIGAFLLLYFSGGSVSWLVILYSINVFITFSLSQFGMVKHWILERKSEAKWFRKMLINGIGLILTLTILFSVIILKFSEGGWITLVITFVLSIFAFLIRRHYENIRRSIIDLQKEIMHKVPDLIRELKKKLTQFPNFKNNTLNNRTAIILVSGYNGTGLYSTFKLIESFNESYSKIVFMQIGILNSKFFKDNTLMDRMKEQMNIDLQKYKHIAQQLGMEADSIYSIGTDVVEEVDKLIPEIISRYKNPIFIGGQLIFDGNSYISKLLHNYTIFAIQRNLYKHGITSIVIPVSLHHKKKNSTY